MSCAANYKYLWKKRCDFNWQVIIFSFCFSCFLHLMTPAIQVRQHCIIFLLFIYCGTGAWLIYMLRKRVKHFARIRASKEWTLLLWLSAHYVYINQVWHSTLQELVDTCRNSDTHLQVVLWLLSTHPNSCSMAEFKSWYRYELNMRTRRLICYNWKDQCQLRPVLQRTDTPIADI